METVNQKQVDSKDKLAEQIGAEESRSGQLALEGNHSETLETEDNRSGQKAASSKKKKKETFWDKYYIYILSTGIPALIMLGVWIFAKIGPGGRSLIIVDGLHQYIPFFSDYYEKLKAGRTLFYSFEEGMGTNFMALWSYYLVSPFNFLILLFPKEQMNTAVSLIVSIKIVLSGYTFAYAALHRPQVKYRHPGIIPLAIAYSMSNFVIGYYWNVMWMDCIFIFPLIILGFEYLVEKKDPKLYILTLFYALLCNYYIGFMICVFLVLWAIVYHYSSVKQLLHTVWMFAISSLLSGGLAAVVLVPAYKGIMQTASAKRVLPGWDQYGSYVDLLQAHLFGVEPINNQVFDGGVNLYCGIFTIFLFFVYLFSREFSIWDKIQKVVLLAFLFISFNTEILNYIWHGFHNQYGIPNRFAFLYIFTLLWIGYEVLLRYRRIHIGVFVAASVCSLGLVALCYSKATTPISKNFYLITVIIVLIYTLTSFIYHYQKNHGKIWRAVLAGLMSVEMIAGAAFGWHSNGTVDVNYYFHDTQAVSEVVQMLYANDDSFYRMELGKCRMLDEPTWHNLRCVTLFGSTALGDMVTAMGRMGFYTGANEYLYRGASPLTNAVTGMRYVLYRGDEFNNNTLYYVGTYNGVHVYENQTPLPVGFAVNRELIDTKMVGTYFDVQNEFANGATGIEAPLFSMRTLDMTAGGVECTATVTGNQISYFNRLTNSGTVQVTITIHDNMDLYMDMSGGNVKQVKLYMDDQLLGNDRYQGQAFHVGSVTEGQQITLEFVLNDGAQDGTITLHAAEFHNDVWDQVYRKLSEQVYQVEEYRDNFFKGTITVNEDQAVFFSIPYEEGWKVLVDGQEVEASEVFDAFLTVPVTAGTHTITLTFVSEGFWLGILITGISVIGFLLFMLFLKKWRAKEELRAEKARAEAEAAAAREEAEAGEEADAIEESDETAVREEAEAGEKADAIEESDETAVREEAEAGEKVDAIEESDETAVREKAEAGEKVDAIEESDETAVREEAETGEEADALEESDEGVVSVEADAEEGLEAVTGENSMAGEA